MTRIDAALDTLDDIRATADPARFDPEAYGALRSILLNSDSPEHAAARLAALIDAATEITATLS